MTTTLRCALCALTAVSVLWAPVAAPANAQTTKLKLVLNWKYQGPQGCSSSPTTAATSRKKASR